MPTKKTNTAFLKMAQAPLKPSPQLAEVLGSATPISRPQVAKKVWAYIKKHELQDPKKRREIVADKKLKPVFGKARLDMFRMTNAISKHLSKEGSVRSEYSAKTTAACPLRNQCPGTPSNVN
jgi:chromatin remodeling complex protein RSC6